MECQSQEMFHDRELDAACLDAGPVICEQCALEELEAIGERLFDAAKPEAETVKASCPLCNRAGVWLAVSLALHAVLLLTLAQAGAFSLSPDEGPMETVVELNLGSLAGPGGSGGDGQLPGGGSSGRPADAPPVGQEPPAAAPPDPDGLDERLETAAPETPQPEAVREPEPAIAPVPVAALETPPRPEPKPEPKPEPRPEAKPAPKPAPKPRREAKSQARPSAAPSAQAPAVAATPEAMGQGTGTGTGSGDAAGPGPGKGPGQGAGPGGFGGEGPGGGGGGEYVGQFGRGDGPTFRHRALPHYPSEAKRGNQEGKVVLRLFIDAEGALRSAEIVEHSGLDFAEEALQAVRKSTFFPAKRNGQPVASRALLAIRFKLE
ncbi:energy transducer TonB [Solidesulfovibrio sp.]|uniref:energy transducer TonB n=1 Tax=Solidesulfovibrio sp. TaxID=2910990 RepID=UPI00260E2433|nr:energy transducer TonB [Solidesulfovibrio sp.]